MNYSESTDAKRVTARIYNIYIYSLTIR
jgi:hypothetical protein